MGQTWIKTARDHKSVRLYGGGYEAFVEQAAKKIWRGAKVNWRIKGNVKAEINNSSWIVKCPFCSGAILHEPGAPYFCPNCLMEGNEGYAMTVEYPEARAEIEAALLRRPNPANRNWHASESVADLIKENEAHGIAAEEKPKVEKPKGRRVLTVEERAAIELVYPEPDGLPEIVEEPKKPEKPEAV